MTANWAMTCCGLSDVPVLRTRAEMSMTAGAARPWIADAPFAVMAPVTAPGAKIESGSKWAAGAEMRWTGRKIPPPSYHQPVP